MSTANSNSYFRDSVLHATPEQLQLMLYDGALRFVKKGRDAIERRDFEQVYENFSRAQKIVLEMEAGLRPEVNPDIAQRMAALYAFVYGKLVDASIHRDIQAVDDAINILQHQRETWVLLMEKVNADRVDAAEEQKDDSQPMSSLSVEC